MDQEAAQRFAALEQAFAVQNRQIEEMARALNGFAEANNDTFARFAEKGLSDMGTGAVFQTIVTGLLARADDATRRDIQAALQVAFEAYGARISEPGFFSDFEITARSVFPEIQLQRDAD